MVRIDLGEITIRSVEEISGPRYKPDFLFPQIDSATVARHANWMVPDLYDPERNLMAMIRQSFVIQSPEHTILIDTCVGDQKPRLVPSFNMLQTGWAQNFRRLGLSVEDIDYVLFTHLHVDHVGWNTRSVDGQWKPTFPKAKYVFGRTEFEYRDRAYREGRDSPDGPVFEDSVAPVVEAGLAVIADRVSDLPDGFRVEPIPGHSPGHVAIHFECPAGHVIFCGDVMHHPIQVREPGLFTRFCEDGIAACETRQNFFESYADCGAIIVPAHFERGSAGRLVRDADGFHFEFLSGASTRQKQ